MEPFYASREAEACALRRAAARARCAVRRLAKEHTDATIACRDGWAAGRLLLALAIEDARTPGAKALAEELRQGAPDDEAFARALHAYTRAHVRFVTERSQIFQAGDFTVLRGAGDCTAQFRLVYAVAVAGGLGARLGLLSHGRSAPRGARGPTHAVPLLELGGKLTYCETTVAAELGEEPNAAARRLGLTTDRSDIAKELTIMSESDLAPMPDDYRAKNDPAQVALDAQALQRLGYLDPEVCAAALSDPTATVLRLAVLAFQRDHAIIADGLLGPTTRLTLARALTDAGPPVTEGFDYPGISGLGDAAKPPIFTHAQARAALHDAYVSLFGKEPTKGELDFGLATAYFETFYGRGGAAGWANRGQFGKWAAQGLYNWGALESGVPGEDATMARFRAAGLHVTKEKGVDAGRPAFFYMFPNDFEAAKAFLMSWGRPDTLAAAASGSAVAVAASMKRHGYYEGFHVGPGGMTPGKAEANRRGSHFVEEASNEIAEQKNISDYAAGLTRSVRVVNGSGGVDNPSDSDNDGDTDGIAGSASLLILAAITGVGAAAAWYLA